MNYKRLFVLVEGDDDERFFEKIITPKLQKKYSAIQLWKYASEKEEKIVNFIRSIKAMRAEYILLADINHAPCITKKKQEIESKFENNIDKNKIVTVVKEIESWYLAGLDHKRSKQLKTTHCDTTDNLTKEQFDGFIPKKFNSRIDFMVEILKYFSIEIAKQKNKSFMYFLKKHNCEI